MAAKLRGVRPHGSGIQISYQYKGRRYFEQIDQAPTASGLAYAARVRQERITRLKFGLQGAPENRESLLFSEVAQEYLNSLNLARSTIISYRNLLNRYWLPVIGHQPIQLIGYRDLQLAVNGWRFDTVKTRNNVLSACRRVFQYALHADLIDSNPALKLESIKYQKPGIDPITPEEWLQIERYLSGDALDYFELVWHTGLRSPGEVIALRWGDYEGDRLAVRKSIVRRRSKGTKTNVARYVALTDGAVEVLCRRPRQLPDRPIFANSLGRHHLDGDFFNQRWQEALKRSGVRYRRAYNLRHGFATRALMAGVNPAFLAKNLGHSTRVLLTTYARWIDGDRDEQEIAKLNRVR